MAKYVIDIDFHEQDCSFCPCFDEEGKYGWCRHSEHEYATGAIREIDSYTDDDGTLCFDRPEWCPLTTVDEHIISEFMANADSQPEKDEEKQTVRLELYESEWDKAGALSLKYRLTMAQTIAKLVEEAYAVEIHD